MKIGFDISVLNDKQRTGIAVYAYNLIDKLLKINQSDQFILFGITSLDTFNYLNSLPLKDYPNVEMKIYRMPSRFFRTAFLLWQKLNWPSIEDFIGDIDIFLSFNWYFPVQRRGKKVGIVFDLTSVIHPEWHDSRTTQLDKIRLQRISKLADLVITISENSRKDFLGRYSSKNDVEVIYPAVVSNIKKRINRNKNQAILKKYDISPGFILSVSTLEPRKNLIGLIEAYLKSKSKRALVLVGGEGWKNQELIDIVNKHTEKIKLTGFIPDEDLVIFYQQAFCLIYPSFYEGFGIPVLEAMSYGTPVICSNTSSLPEVGGDAVIYIDPSNVEEIKIALSDLEQRLHLRKKFIKKGFKQAENFSWRKSARKLDNLFKELAKKD